MGFVPTLTCRHCGKKFSALHGRCPHCGARKVKSYTVLPPKTAQPNAASAAARPTGKRTPKGMAAQLFESNSKWQMMFGGVLVLLVIVAVIVLVSSSLGKGEKAPAETPPIPTVEVTTPPPTTAPPTPTPEPTVPVSSVGISFLGDPISEFTQRVDWSPIQLKAEVYPVEAAATAELVWHSSDESVATVDQTGLVKAVGSGQAEIIAECGGVTASCKVWVP